MLAWRADAGCSGFIEPDIAVLMAELMLTEGLLGFTTLPRKFFHKPFGSLDCFIITNRLSFSAVN